MDTQTKPPNEEHPPLGPLACLTMGFEIVAHHLDLILIPVVLDALLWLGPRLSLAPLFQKLESWFSMAAVEFMDISTTMSMVEGQYAVTVLRSLFEELGMRFNLFVLLGPLPLGWPPSLMSYTYMSWRCSLGVCANIVDITQLPRQEIRIDSLGMLIGWSVLLLLMGLGLNAIYLRMISWRVIQETEIPLPGAVSAWQLWQQLVKLVGVVLLLMFMWLCFVFFFVGCVSLGSSQLGEMVAATLMAFGLFSLLHLLFVIPSMVQQRRHPLQAIRDSLILTRGDFFNVTILMALLWVIWRGFNYVWSQPDPATWQMWGGIIGHAFVSTALITTIFIFYQERLRFVETFVKALATRDASAQSIVSE